ncbi:hypothetical protein [Salinigranum salinum]|uniref:hypothetical protein n=1 Tax=Salinigranum salinum TaxID=1364937 RepID=UPI0018641D09|nr:hypothetical protein [Salinigranum salinum]
MVQRTMCHHVDSYRWDVRTADEFDEEPDESEEPETPAFLVEESAEDVDLLTDGGDEE